MKLRLAPVARALALSWAGFWMFFFVAESAAWHTPVRVSLAWVGMGLLFVFMALVPWLWETAGGLLLMAVGVILGVAYAIWSPPRLPVATQVLTTFAFSGPPLAAGILFMMHRHALTARLRGS